MLQHTRIWNLELNSEVGNGELLFVARKSQIFGFHTGHVVVSYTIFDTARNKTQIKYFRLRFVLAPSFQNHSVMIILNRKQLT
jgi:hypothetical protein